MPTRSEAKRHRKVLKDQIKGITKSALSRLLRRGGVKRTSGKVYEELRDNLKIHLKNVVRDAVTFTEYARRKTVITQDVLEALKRQGKTLYGFDPTGSWGIRKEKEAEEEENIEEKKEEKKEEKESGDETEIEGSGSDVDDEEYNDIVWRTPRRIEPIEEETVDIVERSPPRTTYRPGEHGTPGSRMSEIGKKKKKPGGVQSSPAFNREHFL